MTMGAAVLEWVQPGEVATAKPSIGLMAPLATGASPWQSIHVVPHRPGSSAAARQAHFLVDPDGRSTATDHWKAGKQLPPGGEIRILLISPPRSNDITIRQWAATRELMTQLRDSYGIPDRQVVVDDTLALPTRSARPRS